MCGGDKNLCSHLNPLSPGILDPGNNPGGGLEDPQLENGVKVA